MLSALNKERNRFLPFQIIIQKRYEPAKRGAKRMFCKGKAANLRFVQQSRLQCSYLLLTALVQVPCFADAKSQLEGCAPLLVPHGRLPFHSNLQQTLEQDCLSLQAVIDAFGSGTNKRHVFEETSGAVTEKLHRILLNMKSCPLRPRVILTQNSTDTNLKL